MIDVEKMVKIEYRGEPVLTTRQLAALYGCTTRHVRQNFSHHKEEFIKDVHYYYLEGAELKAFKEDYGAFSGVDKIYTPFTPLASSLYLWTHRGFARHCKLIDTPQAWAMFDKLEKAYFAALEQAQILPPLIPPPELPVSPRTLDLLIQIIHRDGADTIERILDKWIKLTR